MWTVLALLSPVVALVVAAGVMDLRVRRRGVRHSVDGRSARDDRRRNESELRLRSNQQDYGHHGGLGGGV